MTSFRQAENIIVL